MQVFHKCSQQLRPMQATTKNFPLGGCTWFFDLWQKISYCRNLHAWLLPGLLDRLLQRDSVHPAPGHHQQCEPQERPAFDHLRRRRVRFRRIEAAQADRLSDQHRRALPHRRHLLPRRGPEKSERAMMGAAMGEFADRHTSSTKIELIWVEYRAGKTFKNIESSTQFLSTLDLKFWDWVL